MVSQDYDPELEWSSENPCRTELLIIDEADRLKTNGLEQLRPIPDANVACPPGGRSRSGCRSTSVSNKPSCPDGEEVATIVRITGANFRLIERLITQVGRLMDINSFDDISPDLSTAARQTLVIGTQ